MEIDEVSDDKHVAFSDTISPRIPELENITKAIKLLSCKANLIFYQNREI